MVVVRGFGVSGDILHSAGALTPLPFHPAFVFGCPFFVQLGVVTLWFLLGCVLFRLSKFPCSFC